MQLFQECLEAFVDNAPNPNCTAFFHQRLIDDYILSTA